MTTQRSLVGSFKLQLRTLLTIVAILWAIEIVDFVAFGGALNNFGIRPRQVSGLWGILFAPFLHGDFLHLIANTLPLVSMGWLIMLRDDTDLVPVTIITALVGGLGTWLIGSSGVHIGASGVIFGYFGFLLLRGYFERSLSAIAFSIVVAFLYGGIIWGVLPSQPGISWEGHLCGFIGGIIAARLLAKPRRQPQKFDI